MQPIRTLNYNGNTLRVYGTTEKPLFVAAEIGSIIGLSKVHTSLANINPNFRATGILPTNGGNQRMAMLTIEGLRFLVYRSKKEEAVAFINWINTQLATVAPPKIQYQDIDLNEYDGESCVYLVSLSPTEYKFGVSGDVARRFITHRANFTRLGYSPKIVKVWTCKTAQIMRDVEKKIKIFAIQNDIIGELHGYTEIMITDNIEPVIDKINGYVQAENAKNEDDVEKLKLQLEIRKQEVEAARVQLEILKLQNSADNLYNWINNNPPSTREPIAAYYQRYNLRHPGLIGNEEFDRKVRECGYESAKIGTFERWYPK